jgi:hypothetical protein
MCWKGEVVVAIVVGIGAMRGRSEEEVSRIGIVVLEGILNDESRKERGFQVNGSHDHLSPTSIAHDLVEAAHEVVRAFCLRKLQA